MITRKSTSKSTSNTAPTQAMMMIAVVPRNGEVDGEGEADGEGEGNVCLTTSEAGPLPSPDTPCTVTRYSESGVRDMMLKEVTSVGTVWYALTPVPVRAQDILYQDTGGLDGCVDFSHCTNIQVSPTTLIIRDARGFGYAAGVKRR